MVAHYPVGILLMARVEYMGGPQASTLQRYSTGCSVYWRCALEGCSSKIQYHPKPRYLVHNQCKDTQRNNSAASHHGVSKLKSDHRDVEG
ncbi:hypothetical protein TNCV_3063161 [Trichonephila clavipes]|nr:hypothetical protein TNCV_3063161 [Trichonephila clavipes]